MDKKCETCGTSKPIRPPLETSLSYTKRSPSASPSDRRSSSSETETMFNRTGSPSPPRGRRQSSHLESSDDDQHHYSRDANQKQRSSKSKCH